MSPHLEKKESECPLLHYRIPLIAIQTKQRVQLPLKSLAFSITLFWRIFTCFI